LEHVGRFPFILAVDPILINKDKSTYRRDAHAFEVVPLIALVALDHGHIALFGAFADAVDCLGTAALLGCVLGYFLG